MCVCVCVCVRARARAHARTLSHVWFCNPMDCGPPGSSVRGVFLARIVKWVAISYSRGPSQPRDEACVSCISCIADEFLLLSHQGRPILIVLHNTALKNILCSACSSIHPPSSWPYCCLHSSAFSRMSYSYNYTGSYSHIFRLPSFNSYYACKFLPCFFRGLIPLSFISEEYSIVWFTIHHVHIHLWRISSLLPSLVNYELSFCKYPRVGFCVDISFQLLWVNTKVWLLYRMIRVHLVL